MRIANWKRLGGDYVEALLSEVQNSIHLSPSNPREPFKEILNTRAALQVLTEPAQADGSL